MKGFGVATVVTISFSEGLLADVDRQAKRERRSRSELVREAVRLYIDRKKRWGQIFALGQGLAQRQGLTEKDVDAAIRAHRKAKRARFGHHRRANPL